MLLAIDKPSWITSFDVIRILKHNFPKQKIWHSGTLDPMASGLMLVAVGSDTKNLTQLIGLDKSYTATIDFSIVTDTWDMEYWEKITNFELRIEDSITKGLIIADKKISAPSLEEIRAILQKLIPSCELPVPAFSAKKKEGKRLYESAREGEQIIQNKEMKINSYEIISYQFPSLQLRLDVGSGTYIRSIAHRLGEQLHLWWTLTQLRRTSIWSWDIERLPMKPLENLATHQLAEAKIAYAEVSLIEGR